MAPRCRLSIVIFAVVLSSAGTGQTPGTVTFDSSAEDQVLRLTNRERAAYGLPPLQRSPHLDVIARDHSAAMAQRGFFDHVDHRRRDPVRRFAERFPRVIGSVGENIAFQRGVDPSVIAERAVADWMRSPGHRENILSSTYTHLGVGVAVASDTVLLTQNFGLLLCEVVSTPSGMVVHGTTVTVTFRHLGGVPRESLRVHVALPDPTARYMLDRGVTAIGGALLKPVWHGDRFSVAVRCASGRGSYELRVGTDQGYHEPPITIRVR